MKVRENERKCVSIDRRTQTNAKKKGIKNEGKREGKRKIEFYDGDDGYWC
jgi:hypothetical protein